MKRILIPIALVMLLASCDQSLQPSDSASEPLLRATSTSLPQSALLPDLQTVVPGHLQLVNTKGRELIRFSNGIANRGDGPLHLKPRFPLGETGAQEAIQQLFDASGNVAYEEVVSQFEYHPEHNHWHIDAVALYEIHAGSVGGPIVGTNSIKTTFCLIDWYKLEGQSKTPERFYWDCTRTSLYQGISVGWVDQYHHALPEQDLDITGAPEGLYYLVSTANPDDTFIEKDLTNNTAWTSFELKRDSKGNPKIQVVGNSPCTGSMCGVPANR